MLGELTSSSLSHRVKPVISLPHCPNHRETGAQRGGQQDGRDPHTGWWGHGVEGNPPGGQGRFHTGECWSGALWAGRKNRTGLHPSGSGALRAELRPRETSFWLSPLCASAAWKQTRRYINLYLWVLPIVGEMKNKSGTVRKRSKRSEKKQDRDQQ